MADTGSTQFPNSTRVDNNAGNKGAGAKTVLSASLIGVPNANKGAEDKIQHLKGTVINQNDKGQVRIQTEKGIVEAQLPKDSAGRDVPLRQGQKVEVEIPPQKVRERSPDTVRIKTDAPPPQTHDTQRPRDGVDKPDTPQPSENAPLRERPPASSASQIKEVQPPKQPQERANIQVQKPSLANMPAPTITAEGVKQQNTIALSRLAGETIRLDPLPPNLSAQIITPDIEVLPQSISSKAMETFSQLVQQNIDIEQSSALLTLTKQAAQPLISAPLLTSGNEVATNKIQFNQAITSNSQSLTSATFTTPQTQTAPIITGSGDTIPFTKIAPKPIDLINFFAASKITTPAQIAAELSPQIPAQLSPGVPLVAQITQVKPPPLFLISAQSEPDIPMNFAPPPTDIKSIILEGRPPAAITAEVIGKTSTSLPVISIPTAPDNLSLSFILQVPAHDIVAGSTIEITPQNAVFNAPVLSTGVAQMPLPAPGFFLIPGQWPLLDDILQSVQQIAPQAAQAISASIPNAARPAQITPAALFFIAALRAGDLSNILGDRAQQILRTQGKGSLISRLGQEGSIINRTEQASPSEWRSLTIPMAWDNEVQKIALHYKHDHPDNDDKDKGEKQTRFIFDLSLSRMGKVQLDGLHRADRLNLIIRTETGFSQAMQAMMKQAYHDSLASTELSGDLSFQGNLDGWVKINAAPEDHFTEQI